MISVKELAYVAGKFMKCATLVGALTLPAVALAQAGLWTSGGQDLANSRSQGAKASLTRKNVSNLNVQWAATVASDISATPAVDGDSVYVPDWAGYLYRLDRETGATIWQFSINAALGTTDNFSRATPAIHDDLLILGDQGGRRFAGATVMAVDRNTGELVWATKVEDHFAAIVTQSATVHDGVVYVGVASYEEALAAFVPGYVCCAFRGSMLALDADTGAILWKTYTTPEGFSGNAIWGSSPAIDPKRKQLYVATGNNYSAPEAFLDCVTAAGDDTAAQLACNPADNLFDAILAIDLGTGAINWATLAVPFDVWTVSCIFSVPGAAPCPDPAGPDFDFGQAPMLIKDKSVQPVREMVGAGQKSGQFWALDPDSGSVIWVTQVSPGGVGGGLQWGSSWDGTRIYTSSANSEFKPWTLPDGTVTNYGIWSALDPSTGQVLWQTANPAQERAGGAVSSTKAGLVFVCSLDADGHMYALNGQTGDVLWDFASGGSCNSGAAIVANRVFWGSGYLAAQFDPAFTGNTSFYAFGLK